MHYLISLKIPLNINRHIAPALLYFLLCLNATAQTSTYADVAELNAFNGEHLKKNVHVVIVDISENDLFFKRKSQFVGLSGKVGSSRLVKHKEGWYRGAIKFADGSRKFFEEVKISIEIPAYQLPDSNKKIEAGTRIRILGISEEDLYYPNFEKLLSVTGVSTSELIPVEGKWWSGEVKLDNGYLCRFHQVKVEVLE